MTQPIRTGRAVLLLNAQGLSDRQAGLRLGINERAARRFISDEMRLLGVPTRSAAQRAVMRQMRAEHPPAEPRPPVPAAVTGRHPYLPGGPGQTTCSLPGCWGWIDDPRHLAHERG